MWGIWVWGICFKVFCSWVGQTTDSRAGNEKKDFRDNFLFMWDIY
jgi:hypothetical protein